MPDALSKTIPIWCAVINRLLFGEVPENHRLWTPKEVVGASEHAQIEALLYVFVNNVEVTLPWCPRLGNFEADKTGSRS